MRRFEPSFIWSKDRSSSESQRYGVYTCLSKLLHCKSAQLVELGEKEEKQDCILKIAENDTSLSISLGTFETSCRKVHAERILDETLLKCNYRVGELFLQLRTLIVPTENQISARKVHVSCESHQLLEHWLGRIAVEELCELNVLPIGDVPIDIPSAVFQLPHFQKAQILRLMEHCSFTREQFQQIAVQVPHFSFFSNAVSEDEVRNAIGQITSSSDSFVVMEWFFTRKVDTKGVLRQLVRPRGERRERFNQQSQLFDPVEIYSIPNENDKRFSVMVVEDVKNGKPYSLALYR